MRERDKIFFHKQLHSIGFDVILYRVAQTSIFPFKRNILLQDNIETREKSFIASPLGNGLGHEPKFDPPMATVPVQLRRKHHHESKKLFKQYVAHHASKIQP